MSVADRVYNQASKEIDMQRCLMSIIIILLLIGCIPGEALALDERPVALQEGLTTLTRQLLSRRSDIGNRKIVVADLTPLHGETGNLSSYISEELMVMMQDQGARILERSLLFEALNELKLNMTDLVDPSYSKQFGHFTGTELLLLGVMTEFQETMKINARLVDIGTLNIVSVGDVLIKKDKHVQKIMGIPYPGRIVIDTVRGSTVLLDNVLIGQVGMWGQIKIDKVAPGSHTITVQREGYRTDRETIFIEEDQEVHKEVVLSKLPSPGVAVFLSAIFPGGGDIYLGHNDWWLYTLGVGGSIYGAVYYSQRTEDLVWVKNDTGSGQHIEERGEGPMYAFAALAAGIWIYDLVHVSSSAKASRITQSNQQNANGFMVIPEPEGSLIGYRWTW